jgi:hypothetical protein
MGCAKGDDVKETAKGGAVSSRGRCDPVAGCRRPDNILARSPASPPLPDPASQGPSGYAPGRTAKGGAVSSEGRCDPVAGCLRPDNILARSGIPTAARFPLRWTPRATLRGGSLVALLSIVVSATTFVARLMIIPILPAMCLTRTCSGLPLGGRAG